MRPAPPTYLTFLLVIFSVYAFAQQYRPTGAEDRREGFTRRQSLAAESLVAGLPFTNIGPSIMSGRVSDVAVDPQDPTHFYVGYASGGLWETTDNGSTYTPLFDNEAVMTVGDLDVHWASGTIYLGTGEVNSSRSSYAGDGVYRSTDGGKSWMHLGLDETHHIGRVIVDQDDANRVWVAALGHLYGPNPERGLFVTRDGGETWDATLQVNDSTGVIDLVRDPLQPDHLYAATWQRERKAWNFVESGPGSAIYESRDGGESWTPLSGPTSGFPSGEGVGRIGLAVSYDAEGTRHLFASLDNYFLRANDTKTEDEQALTKNRVREMPAKDLLRLETYLLEDFLRNNAFPRDLTAESVRRQLESGEISPLQLVEYLEDANSELFDTPVKGFELYELIGENTEWKRTHEDYLDGVYYSYGYYFGQIAVHPRDPSTIYAMGVPIIKSTDGGKTWAGANGDNVHSDHHYLWINPDKPDHLINGNDGGINISYNGGQSWLKSNVPPLGQYYAVAVDNHPDGYRVYGGLQDNGTWRGPHDYRAGNGWQQNGRYPYESLMGGDGMQVQVDPRDHETAYVGFQFGNYFRVNQKEGERKLITPRHKLGQRPYRWNWQAPILISPHQPDIFYMGSNFLHRSLNRGDEFTTISDDLTAGGRFGDVAYGTLTTIDESPLQFGLLYTGSDDGRVHRSDDGGNTWKRLDESLPQNLWVSRVDASHADKNVVYLSLNGYRDDNFTSYVYRSTDRGDNWSAVGTDLPSEPVNVVKEDPLNPALLYVGTDHGLYVSTDTGRTFQAVTDLPAVAVHDVVVQTTAKDLIVGTHGRSLYRASVGLLQQVAGSSESGLVLADVPAQRYSSWYGSSSWSDRPSSPEVSIQFYHGGDASRGTMTVSGFEQTLFEQKIEVRPGINVVTYDLSFSPKQATAVETALNKAKKEGAKPETVEAAENGRYYLRPGNYRIVIEVNGTEAETALEIK